MSEIYKINVVKNNKITDIFVFAGPNADKIPDNKYFSRDEKIY